MLKLPVIFETMLTQEKRLVHAAPIQIFLELGRLDSPRMLEANKLIKARHTSRQIPQFDPLTLIFCSRNNIQFDLNSLFLDLSVKINEKTSNIINNMGFFTA